MTLTLASSPASAALACPPGQADYGSFYQDAKKFTDAIAKVADIEPSNERLTGIVVPHHLLADHLVALGFRAASGFDYKRIILLSPDHFKRSTKPFATTTHGFGTVFGPVATDAAAVRSLVAENDFVEDSCLFAGEHGVHALLPFLHHYFPRASIVPVAVAIRGGRADWDRMVEALKPLVDADTLIVESTDFSHYLPQHEARLFDQQTLNVLASGSLDALAGLRQPVHADSVGSLYIQTRLQQDLYAARPLAVANESSQQYSAGFIQETTSYLVLLYGQFGPKFNDPLRPGDRVTYLAGDTLFGRGMLPVLLDERAAERIEQAILARTKGRPLVVNLEGVILPDVPEGLPALTLVMPEALTVDWLRRLNVVGVGLANNHAMDLGPSGHAETRRALKAAGIPSFGQGEVLELPGLDLVGLTDIGANGTSEVDLISPALLDRLARPAGDRPVVAFVHWGSEYRPAPGPRETALADAMRLSAVTLIAGAHPHVASGAIEALAGGDTALVHSLGNFLFDQRAANSSGALLEVRQFEQGTIFPRLIPLPNLFEMRE